MPSTYGTSSVDGFHGAPISHDAHEQRSRRDRADRPGALVAELIVCQHDHAIGSGGAARLVARRNLVVHRWLRDLDVQVHRSTVHAEAHLRLGACRARARRYRSPARDAQVAAIRRRSRRAADVPPGAVRTGRRAADRTRWRRSGTRYRSSGSLATTRLSTCAVVSSASSWPRRSVVSICCAYCQPAQGRISVEQAEQQELGAKGHQ